MKGEENDKEWWKFKPKCSSHNFQKFPIASHQNKDNEQIKNIAVAMQSVGVIRSTWKSQSNYMNFQSVSGFTFGTAVLVSKNLLMTCSHNIYSKSKKSFAHQIQFVPGIEKGRPEHNKFTQRRATLTSKNMRTFASLYSKEFVNEGNSELEPSLEEICLIYLDPISESEVHQNTPQNFLQIGSLDKAKYSKLKMFGYPSDKFKSQIKFQKAHVERVTMNGVLHSIGSFQIGYKPGISTDWTNLKHQKIDEIINYTMKTKIGCSGSPILATNPNNQLYIVGIHTHRGREDDYNSGVYFGTHMIKLIKHLEKMLEENLSKHKQKIDYYYLRNIPDRKQSMKMIRQEQSEDQPKFDMHKGQNIEQSASSNDSKFNKDHISQDSKQSQISEKESQKQCSVDNDSQYSSCTDENYIQDFYNFLTISKISNHAKHQSQEYFVQVSIRALISLITIYFLPNSRLILPYSLEIQAENKVAINKLGLWESSSASSSYSRAYLLSK